MKKYWMLAAAVLSFLLVLTLTACGGGNGADETISETVPPTEAPTEMPTEPPTEAPTETPTEAPTEEPTEAPTEEPTEAPTEAETDPPDPYTTPVPVGKSYDGVTTCYDGRLEHDWEVFKSAGQEWPSIQDAVDAIEGVGGNISLQTSGDVGLCLYVEIPKDGCFYRINYNLNNCDFVFNYGYTYDDGRGGYAYYSDLDRLDAIKNLDNTHVYVWSAYDELEPGCYLMTLNPNAAEGQRQYLYEFDGTLEETWPGLPWGETYFDW